MAENFLNGRVVLHAGDMLAVLPTLEENSIDACVCDPPYHLSSIVKRFGADDAAPAKISKKWVSVRGGSGPYVRSSTGFMGKVWDGGDIAFQVETWRQVLRVLKPGAHLLAFGGTRTYGRMQAAIEESGFEVRDTIAWVFGSGFPKSHDVSKGIDRAAGVEREIVARDPNWRERAHTENVYDGGLKRPEFLTTPATDSARDWAGWGTALKPAMELICVARKPLSEPTIAANVLKWGTGALNIDGCRVQGEPTLRARTENDFGLVNDDGWKPTPGINGSNIGRWPANVIHDGSAEVLAGFPESNNSGNASNERAANSSEFFFRCKQNLGMREFGDSGSAARFFYTAKADTDDRLGSKHPTVKPLDLMQYLVRLVTPPNGTVLDCFAGTGTTGEAAFREGFSAVLIEREAEYQADIRRRMALILAGPDERAREAIKERMKDKPRDDGPLFGGVA